MLPAVDDASGAACGHPWGERRDDGERRPDVDSVQALESCPPRSSGGYARSRHDRAEELRRGRSPARGRRCRRRNPVLREGPSVLPRPAHTLNPRGGTDLRSAAAARHARPACALTGVTARVPRKTGVARELRRARCARARWRARSRAGEFR